MEKVGRAGGKPHYEAYQELTLANAPISASGNIEDFRSLANPTNAAEKKSPDALAGANGAVFDASHITRKAYGNSANPSNSKVDSFVGKFIKPRHKRMSRVLGYSLTLGTSEAWQGFGLVAAANLMALERAFMASVLLATLDLRIVEEIAAEAVSAAGQPLPPFLGGMDDARSWASWASPSELKAYALACFEAMPPSDQAAFYQHISTIEVAA